MEEKKKKTSGYFRTSKKQAASNNRRLLRREIAKGQKKSSDSEIRFADTSCFAGVSATSSPNRLYPHHLRPSSSICFPSSGLDLSPPQQSNGSHSMSRVFQIPQTATYTEKEREWSEQVTMVNPRLHI